MAVRVRFAGAELLYEDGGRYDCGSPEEVPGMLQRHGVAVLPGLLTPEECAAMNEGMWATCEHLTSLLAIPLRREDPATYRAIFDLAPLHGGLFQHFGWGHAQYVWDVRGLPKVSAAHAAIHGCAQEDLLVSFDGVTCALGSLIPGGRPRGRFHGECWLHTDQRLASNEAECVQSWVTANAIRPGDGTLRFLEGSHVLHGAFAAAFGLTGAVAAADWFKLDGDHRAWYAAQGCRDTCLAVPAGSQVFWDSRTIHSGQTWLPRGGGEEGPREGGEEAPREGGEEGPREARNVVYVCYQPRHPGLRGGLPTRVRNLRRGVFGDDPRLQLRLTTHWVSARTKLFPRRPRLYGRRPFPAGSRPADPSGPWSFVPPLPPPVLTPWMQRLAGLDD